MCTQSPHTCYCGAVYDCQDPNWICPTINEDEECYLCPACLEREAKIMEEYTDKLPKMYHGDWTCLEDMTGESPDKYSAWEGAKEGLRGMDVVYACYETPPYEGYAICIYRDERGQLWEVHDSHCSCYGLENWKPEQTTKEAILMRRETQWPGLTEALEFYA